MNPRVRQDNPKGSPQRANLTAERRVVSTQGQGRSATRWPLHTGGRPVRDHVAAILVVAACVVVRRLTLPLTEDLIGRTLLTVHAVAIISGWPATALVEALILRLAPATRPIMAVALVLHLHPIVCAIPLVLHLPPWAWTVAVILRLVAKILTTLVLHLPSCGLTVTLILHLPPWRRAIARVWSVTASRALHLAVSTGSLPAGRRWVIAATEREIGAASRRLQYTSGRGRSEKVPAILVASSGKGIGALLLSSRTMSKVLRWALLLKLRLELLLMMLLELLRMLRHDCVFELVLLLHHPHLPRFLIHLLHLLLPRKVSSISPVSSWVSRKIVLGPSVPTAICITRIPMLL